MGREGKSTFLKSQALFVHPPPRNREKQGPGGLWGPQASCPPDSHLEGICDSHHAAAVVAIVAKDVVALPFRQALLWKA